MGEEQQLSRDKKRFNAQINYAIIQKMWDCHNKTTNSLYSLMGLDSRQYYLIRSGKRDNVDTLWKEKKKEEKGVHKIGLPKDVMVGNKMINISGISTNDWLRYFICNYNKFGKRLLNELQNDETKEGEVSTIKEVKGYLEIDEDYRKIVVQEFEALLKGKLQRIGDGNDELGKLYHFCKYHEAKNSISEIEQLRDSLRNVSISQLRNCKDEQLQIEVLKLLSEKKHALEIIIEYNQLG